MNEAAGEPVDEAFAGRRGDGDGDEPSGGCARIGLVGCGLVVVVLVVAVVVAVTRSSPTYSVGLPATVAGMPATSSPAIATNVSGFSGLTRYTAAGGRFGTPRGGAYVDRQDDALLIVVVASATGVDPDRFWSLEQQAMAVTDHNLDSQSAVDPGPHGGRAWFVRRNTSRGWVTVDYWVTGSTYGAVIPDPLGRAGPPNAGRMASLLVPIRGSVETRRS